MRVDNSARSGGIIKITLIFYTLKVCCVFSLELPHRGDSNEYTQHTISNIKRKLTRNYPKYNNVCSCGTFCWGLKNEFEIAQVNEPSVFEPLKFYCMLYTYFLSFSREIYYQREELALLEANSFH